MNEIFQLLHLTLLLKAGFVIALITGLVLKNKKLLLLSALLLVLSLFMVAYTVYTGGTKLAKTIGLRGWNEYYVSAFGAPVSDCVHISNCNFKFREGIGNTFWFRFKACPEEIKRVLGQHPFEKSIIASVDWDKNDSTEFTWYRPQFLGDTVFIYRFNPKGINEQVIYSDLKQTELFCSAVAQ